jgi:hypothetical protein
MIPIIIQRREINQQLKKQSENKPIFKCSKRKTVGNINNTCLKRGKERNFDLLGLSRR